PLRCEERRFARFRHQWPHGLESCCLRRTRTRTMASNREVGFGSAELKIECVATVRRWPFLARRWKGTVRRDGYACTCSCRRGGISVRTQYGTHSRSVAYHDPDRAVFAARGT